MSVLWFQVSVIYHQSKKVILLVDKSYVKSVENPHKITLPFSDIYIGGAPSQVLSARSAYRHGSKVNEFSVTVKVKIEG